MKYKPREEVVDHSVSQRVTLQLCMRCGRRPDGLDETRGVYETTIGKWDSPFITLSMREFDGRGAEAHKKAMSGESFIGLCPMCTIAFHDFMAATKGEGK